MNELREQVQGLIDKHDVDSYRASVGAEHSSYPSAAVTTDRILALIADAMLSEEAVEAAVKSRTMRPAVLLDSRSAAERMVAKQEIQAALAAAGITKGDAREGGEW